MFISIARLRERVCESAAEDGALLDFATQACAIVEAHLARPVEARSFAEVHHGGDRALFVRHRPIVSVQSIRDVYIDEPATGYRVDPDAGAIYAANSDWAIGTARWRVSYRAGFEEIPALISEAALRLAEILWHEAKDGMRIRRESIGDVGFTYLSPDEDRTVRGMLQPYVRVAA
ncbi:MAG: hypothetical protein AAFR11_05780 [Pseudomonadota bacterium]